MYVLRGLGALSISDLINQAAAKYSLSPQLLYSVAQHESALNPNAVSPAGAQGVMQLMPATAAQLGVSNPFDPSQNIDAGARYLSQLLTQYNGDTSLALAAYNAGPGNVAKYGGIPPFPETQAYVSGILADVGGGGGTVSPDSSPLWPSITDSWTPPSSVQAGISDNAMLALGIAGIGLLVWAVA
jgi:transglycosylase-like protein with SLT domain